MGINLHSIRVFLFPFLIVLLPFVYFEVVPDPTLTPVFLYLNVACLSYLLLSFFEKRQSVDDLFQKPFFGLFLLYFVFHLLLFALKPFRDSLYGLAGISAVVLYVYTLYAYLTAEQENKKWLAFAICLTAVLFSFVGYFQWFAEVGNKASLQDLYLVRSHLGHKNLMAIYLAASLPACYYLYSITTNKDFRLAILVAVFFVAGLIVLSYSRVGIVCLLIFFLFMAYVLFERNKYIRAYRIPFLVLLLLIPVLLGAFFYFNHYESFLRMVSFFQVTTADNDHTATIAERLLLWKKTILLAKENLWLGVGIGQWKIEVCRFGLYGLASQFGTLIHQRPHNDYLWVLAESGIGGAIIYVLLFLYPLFVLLRQKQNSLSIALFAGLLILAVAGLTDFPKERPALLFLMAFYWSLFLSTQQAVWHTIRISRKVGLILFITLGLAGSGYFAVHAAGEHAVDKLLKQRLENDLSKTTEEVAFAKQCGVYSDLTSTPLAFYEAEFAYSQKDINGAIAHFHQSLAINRFHLMTLSELGSCYSRLGDTARALLFMDSALAISPLFPDPHISKALYAFKRGDFQQASKDVCFKMSPGTKAKYFALLKLLAAENCKELKAELTDEKQLKLLDEIPQKPDWLFNILDRAVYYGRTLKVQIALEVKYVAEHN